MTMIRALSRLLSALRPRPGASTSTDGTTDAGLPGPVDPLDPLKRDEELPGADPIVPPVPPEV